MGVRELAEYLIKSLADRPEEVVLEEHEEDDTIVLDLKIAPETSEKLLERAAIPSMRYEPCSKLQRRAIRSGRGWSRNPCPTG